MEKPDTSRIMRQLAAKMRLQAQETALPEYQSMMRRTANALDAEAMVIADRQLLEFARELEVFSASQFTARYH
jgi:histone H3/H4